MTKEKITVMEIAKKENSEKPERFIYLGPNLLKFGLQKYQVFKGSKPPILETLKIKYSLIEQLFAPIKDVNNLMDRIKTKGTSAYLACEQILTGGKD